MLIIDVNTSSFNNAATSTSPISTATPNGATFLTGNQLQQQQKIIPSPIYTAVSSSPASSTTTTPVSTPSSTTITSPPVTNVKKRKNSSVRDDKGGKKAKKVPNFSLKKPPNPFIFFTMTKRMEISAKKPGIKSTEINSLLGEVWRNMSEEDKKPYLQMRDTALEQYEKDLANDVMYQEAVKIARKILDGLETDLNDRWYEYELPTSLNNLVEINYSSTNTNPSLFLK
nr:3061_t:CDS:2 [Entrophospora candida]